MKERSIILKDYLEFSGETYEEVIRGNAEEVRNYFDKKKDKVKGEFVVIIEGGVNK